MADAVDFEARENIHNVQLELQGLEADYWGPRKDNGFRSRVIKTESGITALQEALRDLTEKLRTYLDREREETCKGLAELARRDQAAAQAAEEDIEVEVAKIQAGATLGAADRAAKAATWREWIILIGVLASVFVEILK